MAFAIKNKEGVRESLNTIDELACAFWNKDIHQKSYCRIPSGGNWFDIIGWAISHQKEHSSVIMNTWESVKLDMLHTHTFEFTQLSAEEAGLKMCELRRYLQDSYNFIDHLASLGYTPEQIK